MDAITTWLDSLHPLWGMLIALFLAVWALLVILLPFFVYGACRSAWRCSRKLDVLIRLERESRR